MPNSVSKRRSRFAMLAVFAVVASLFTAALPASAATGDVEFPATFSACVGGATASGGFTDTTGNFAAESINCLKYYGITTGTTATTYSPGQNVTRWQMALFLVRAAGPAGITVPAAASQGFTDIVGLPQATQDAINQLKALGISQGTSTTTYGPNEVVARYQMALFLIRFLEVQNGAASLPTGTSASGLTDTGAVSNEAFLAIEKAWDHGITKGTTATLFSPGAAVTRDQMAAFIARTLAHTNARPSGVSMQAVPATVFSSGDVDIQISVRDSAFKPVGNALVDVFQAPLASKATALKADGTCDTSIVVFSPFGGATRCTIDISDPDTDGSGNITSLNVTPATWGGASAVWWAWTGTSGATFDVDTTAVASAEVTVNAAATKWLVTSTVPENSVLSSGSNQVKYGTSVTHTFQLVDAAEKSVALAGKKVTLLIETWVNGVLNSSSVTTQTSDAAGKLSFTVSNTDPNVALGDETEAEISVVTSDGFGAPDFSDVANGDEDIMWNDDASAATTIVVAAVDKAYTTGTSLNVKATVYDQFGLGLSGQLVDFWADAAQVGNNRPTNSNGVAAQTYSDPGGTSASVNAYAELDGGAIDDNIDVYFVIEETGSSGGPQTVLVWDAAADAVVYDDGDYTVAFYDANDQLNAGTPKTYDAFDKLVGDEPTAGLWFDVSVANYAASDANISQLTLS